MGSQKVPCAESKIFDDFSRPGLHHRLRQHGAADWHGDAVGIPAGEDVYGINVFDAASNRTTSQAPDGSTNTYTYDNAGNRNSPTVDDFEAVKAFWITKIQSVSISSP